MTDLDSLLNSVKPSKHGNFKDPERVNFSNDLDVNLSKFAKKDSITGKGIFTGITLRIEAQTSEGGTNLYEPGSFPSKKYNGKSSTPPELVALKVRIPTLHYMLPIPSNFGPAMPDECEKGGKDLINRCHHPIIDMYPTFYAEKPGLVTPPVGSLVRVKYADIDNFKDPMYIGPEAGDLYFAGAGGIIAPSGATATGETINIELPNLPGQSELAREALKIAIASIGQGETVANNRGQFISTITGTNTLTNSKGTNWCAGLVSWCFAEAAKKLGVKAPFPHSNGSKVVARSSADRSTSTHKGIAIYKYSRRDPPKKGAILNIPEILPGDIISWERGGDPKIPRHKWKFGHIGIVYSYNKSTGQLVTIEGNASRFPSKVQKKTKPKEKAFLWDKLYSISRIADK